MASNLQVVQRILIVMYVTFANTYNRISPSTLKQQSDKSTGKKCYSIVASNYCDNNLSIQWIAKASNTRRNNGDNYQSRQ